MTLRMTQPDGTVLILDAGDLTASSGLISGARIEPVLESHPGDGRRTKLAIAALTVMNGSQEQVVFLPADRATTIGRDRANRVELHDLSVSRRHAILRRVGDALEIEDLGSANGTSLIDANGERIASETTIIRFNRSATVEFGTVRVQVTLGPPATAPTPFDSTMQHVQSPHVDPVFNPPRIELPAPPDEAESARFPLIAMVAPLIMGGVLYLTTHSTMSLIFVALSPLIMIGSWFDNRLTRRKTTRRKLDEFETGITQCQQELEVNITRERTSRDAESPSATTLASFVAQQDPRVWSRRPEHRAFLELRLGTGTLASRKTVDLPPRGKIAAAQWARLTEVHDRYATIDAVPVLERLDRCGSIGIAGHPAWAASAARAILLQLTALHSPADLVVTAFANNAQADAEWAWVKWLPHADSAYSPISGAHLAADERSGNLLLTELEGLIADRAADAHAGQVRSRMSGNAADAGERLAATDREPMHPAVIVLVLADTLVDRTRVVGLAEDGADVSVHILWIARSVGDVPAACRTVIEAHTDIWRAHFVRQSEVVELSSLEGVELPAIQTYARELAPFVDAGARVLDESDLPRSVALARIVPGDILGSAEAIEQQWRATDSLVANWRPGGERAPGTLAAVVGQGSAGAVEIDLRLHGPHALVGGTTGSGKSEFLQTWILSLAANYAPDRLTFLLVDYKGGAAFADCVDLPHTVGLVTDLNTHLVRRALTSLRAELRYREELLAEKGAKDLIALERRGDSEAPPALVIVIDEFAALAKEIPEFVDGVIDVAQRGRSLGLHLVMATQRPAGVITDNLRANTNLRVALRMADPADSSDVIGVADAALFSPEVPGRAAIKVGAGRLAHLQAGYLGGRAETEHRDAVEVRDLEFGERDPWNLIPEARSGGARAHRGTRDIETLANNIRNAAQHLGTATPRRPWVDQLPDELPVDSLQPPSAAPRSARRGAAAGVLLGLIDEPQSQRQSPYMLQLAEIGNLAIFGGAGSGKTTALLSLAVSAVTADPRTHLYGIDCAGGRLGILRAMPHTGDIVPGDERDRVIRLLALAKHTIAERTAAAAENPAPVIVLLDGLAAFRDAHEHRGGGGDPFADLIDIAASGRSVNVHVVLTSERSNGLPASLASSFSERLALQLTAEADYQMLGVPLEALENAGPGRAIRIGSGHELQIALPGASGDLSDTRTALEQLALRFGGQLTDGPAPVPAVPVAIDRSDIVRSTGASAPFALDTDRLEGVGTPSEGLALVTGPAGSGRTHAVRSLLAAMNDDAGVAERPLDAVLIAPRRSELRTAAAWSTVADTAESRTELIERLTRALGGTPTAPAGLTLLPLVGTVPPGAEPSEPAASAATIPPPFPRPGARAIVVIEDIGGFDGSGNEAALGALLKLLRRSDATTIVEGENATLGTVWELASPLRGARWALALQPDANDAPSVFTTPFTHAKRADFPPGRGFLVQSGRITGVHVGL